jgi:hypothetical protein
MNEVDLAELPADVRSDMTFVPVRTLEEALAVSLPAAVDSAVQGGGSAVPDSTATAARAARD